MSGKSIGEYLGTLLGTAIVAWLMTFAGATFMLAWAISLGLSVAGQILVWHFRPSRKRLLVMALVAATWVVLLAYIAGVIKLV